MTRFNLSAWALNNRALLRYFIVVLGVGYLYARARGALDWR